METGEKLEKWPKFKISKSDFQTEIFRFSVIFVILRLMLLCTELNSLSGNTNFDLVRLGCKKLLNVEKMLDRHYSEICDFAIFDIHFVHRIEYRKWCVIVIYFNCVYAEFNAL